VKATFTFQSKTCYAGSFASFQLSLQSNARKPTPLISSVKLTFTEQIPEIVMTHGKGDSKRLQKLELNATNLFADLSLSPRQRKYFEFSFTPISQAQIEVISRTGSTYIGIILVCCVRVQWTYRQYPLSRIRTRRCNERYLVDDGRSCVLNLVNVRFTNPEDITARKSKKLNVVP